MKPEFDGEKYKLASTQQKTWGKKLISELHLKGSERILDLGCGDGPLTAELAKLVPDGLAVGIDSSESMIRTAQMDHAAPNLRFELQDINTIDFESQFDLVFSNATLHWIKDHGRLLKHVFKSLKPNGSIRFQFAGAGNCSKLIEVVSKVMSAEAYAGYFRGFDWPWFMPSAEDYRRLTAEVPFADRRVWSENADRYFDSVETLTKWIDQPSLVPFLACIAQRDRRSFRDAVVEQMIAETRQDDGRYFETFRRINVFARK